VNIGDLVASYYFRGNLANVQLYNTALLPVQISQMYQQGISNLPAPTNALVGWWLLNTDAKDYSGNGNNGVPSALNYALLLNYSRDSIFNTPAVTQLSPLPGILSCSSVSTCGSNSIPQLYLGYMPLEFGSTPQVANFNGASSYLNAAHTSSMDFVGGVTIVSWIRPDIVNSWSQASVVQDFESAGNLRWKLGLTNYGSARVDICGYTGCGTGNYMGLAGGNVLANNWYQIAGTFDGSTVSLYLNGNQVATTPWAGTLPNVQIPIKIGYEPYNVRYFKGNITNVQVYSTALSSAQVSQLFSQGPYSVPFASGLVGWWPLNGDPNDYSGNGNNANAFNIIYPYFAGTFNAPGVSAISNPENEWQALGLANV
jgi:hypothetical protein